MIRPLRGRARLECLPTARESAILFTPDTVNKLDRKIPRRGRVIALGPPALNKRGKEIPWDVKIGDVVLYIFGQISTTDNDAWVAQDEILGQVIE